MTREKLASTLSLWAVLRRYWPDCEAESIQNPGEDEQLVIVSEDGPAVAEVKARRLDLATEILATEYQGKRAVEYPDLSEFADAYYWVQQGDTSRMDSYLAKCGAVKAAHPKPEAT